MNEERVRQILDIESQAQQVYQEAMRQAQELPDQAEKEAERWVNQARKEAQAKAQQLVDQAQVETECEDILRRARDEADRMEDLAQSHLDRAVGYILDRLAGKE